MTNAQLATTTNAAPASPGHVPRRRFTAIWDLLVSASAAMACLREAEWLMRLSDTELAAKGLRREDIVRHAFARYLAQ